VSPDEETPKQVTGALSKRSKTSRSGKIIDGISNKFMSAITTKALKITGQSMILGRNGPEKQDSKKKMKQRE